MSSNITTSIMAAVDHTGVPGIDRHDVTSKTVFHPIPEHIMAVLEFVFSLVLQGIIPLIGVISNVCNIAIFYKLGIKDSMSLGLFTLSVADFTAMLLQLAISMAYVANLVHPESAINSAFLLWVLAWPQTFAYRISYWIITIISTERCVCVVWPFRVKQIFTRTRCAMAISAVFIIHVLLHIPVYVPKRVGLTELTGQRGNKTVVTKMELKIIYNEETTQMEFITDISVNLILALASQVIIFVCTLWMIVTLKSSSKIRQSDYYQQLASSTVSSSESPRSHLSLREKRLVKMVLFLAILLTVCDLPRLIAVIALYAVPGMSTYMYPDYYVLMFTIAYFVSSIGSSSNFVVYITLNASYRNILSRWCRCGRE